ncbi:MarR family winged helix-turn-helix transcriptional regulator [Nocardia alba]|uniref:DNA-binding MarR family transcriptional regulator n=1 Tax=Nocardia alba TaxID=225051 RepID=A0A4R1FAR8_9NOCA|nr:MarR family winged helix-turn-helix transcriptional regulator [Nocardia alba]TCJ89892.1 DNA-binding MarR family transcriptional regulator [Nocardia alba]
MHINEPSYLRNAGFLLSRVGAMCESSWFRLINAEGIGQVEFALMSVLRANGPMRQRDAARAAGIEPRNVVGSVDRLRHRELINAEPAAHDRRVKQLTISGAGEQLLTRLGNRLGQESESFLNPLDEHERRVLTDLLWKMYAHKVIDEELRPQPPQS